MSWVLVIVVFSAGTAMTTVGSFPTESLCLAAAHQAEKELSPTFAGGVKTTCIFRKEP